MSSKKETHPLPLGAVLRHRTSFVTCCSLGGAVCRVGLEAAHRGGGDGGERDRGEGAGGRGGEEGARVARVLFLADFRLHT